MRYEIIGKNGYVPTEAVENYLKKRLKKSTEMKYSKITVK